MTAVRDHSPDALQPILPLRPRRVIRAHVLAEEELPSWAEHAPDLSERGVRIGDRAQHGGRDHRVEGAVVERKPLGRRNDERRLPPGLGEPLRRARSSDGAEGSLSTSSSTASG